MQGHFLLRSQQNAVFEAIQSAGLTPADFTWEETHSLRAGGKVPLLVHQPSGASFKFDFDRTRTPNWAWVDYVPGFQYPRDELPAKSWAEQLDCVNQWLRFVRREWEAPDLWDELAAQRELVAGLERDADNNSPFTADEQAEITRKLEEIKTYVRETSGLSETQYKAIERRLDYVVDAASRLGRLDWRNMFVGAFLGAVIQAELPPGPVQEVLNLALRGLSHLFGVELPQLPS